MANRAFLSLRGRVAWKLRRADGVLLAEGCGPNVVTQVAMEQIAMLLYGDVVDPIAYMAMGSGGDEPDSTQTALSAEFTMDRQAVITTRNGRVVNYQAILGPDLSGTVTVREIGLFDLVLAGNMWARFLAGGFEMAATDQLQVDWELTIGEE